MDCAPNVNIFRELQVVHDTGYFSSQVSPEEDWQQVCETIILILQKKVFGPESQQQLASEKWDFAMLSLLNIWHLFGNSLLKSSGFSGEILPCRYINFARGFFSTIEIGNW